MKIDVEGDELVVLERMRSLGVLCNLSLVTYELHTQARAQAIYTARPQIPERPRPNAPHTQAFSAYGGDFQGPNFAAEQYARCGPLYSYSLQSTKPSQSVHQSSHNLTHQARASPRAPRERPAATLAPDDPPSAATRAGRAPQPRHGRLRRGVCLLVVWLVVGRRRSGGGRRSEQQPGGDARAGVRHALPPFRRRVVCDRRRRAARRVAGRAAGRTGMR